jgi:hypothetical protein
MTKPAGKLYFVESQFGLEPEVQRYPSGSPQPVPKNIVGDAVDLNADEMKMKLSELQAKYTK